MVLLLAPAFAWANSEDYMVVSMNQVPERVRGTAMSAKPGIYVTRIVRLEENDDLSYRFYASQVGRYWVIVVRDDGQLIDLYESPSAPPRLSKAAPND
jgi:hypothetical protein